MKSLTQPNRMPFDEVLIFNRLDPKGPRIELIRRQAGKSPTVHTIMLHMATQGKLLLTTEDASPGYSQSEETTTVFAAESEIKRIRCWIAQNSG